LVSLCPTRLKPIRKLAGGADKLDLLDIGCGNHSPTITKRWLKNCTYTGVDITEECNLDAEDRRIMDRFILVGADGTGYGEIPDRAFDVIILSHVIEHMRDPAPILATLCKKLRPGGYIYLSFPSLRSLSLPSGNGTTLNFCDDSTHIRIPDVREIAQLLLNQNVRIIRAGRSIDVPRYVIGASLYPYVLLRKVITGKMHGRGLWQFLGFEDMVFGQRRIDG